MPCLEGAHWVSAYEAHWLQENETGISSAPLYLWKGFSAIQIKPPFHPTTVVPNPIDD